MTIAALAANLIATANSGHVHKIDALDAVGRPLLEALQAAGHIPAGHIAHIEWQGVWEFGHVPVCHGKDHDCSTPQGRAAFLAEKPSWLCVHGDGRVQAM